MPDYTFAISGSDFSDAAWKTFIDNVKKANQQIADLKKPLTDVASSSTSTASGIEKLNNAIDYVKTGLKGLAGLWVVQQVRDYADGLQAAGVNMTKLAASSGLTLEQVQALQRASRLGGEEFDKLAEYARSDTEWLDKVTESARRANTVIGADTVKALDDAAKASEQAKREAGDLSDNFNRLAGPTITWGLAQLSGGFKSIAESIDLIRVNGGKALPTIREIANILTGGQASRIAGESADKRAEDYIQTLESNVVNARQALARNVALHGEQSVPARRARAEVKSAEDALLETQQADIRRRDRNQAVQGEKDQKLFNPTIIPSLGQGPFGGIGSGEMDFSPKGGGGGGGASRDRIGENLQLYTEQAVASKRALEELRAVAQQPLALDDLEREIKLRKDIADAEAQAAKFARNDPRIAQLREQITLRETAESGYRKFMDALKLADTTERQYGDGQLQFLQTQNQLNDARNTGRLKVEAYDNAMKVLGQSTEDLRLKNLGLQGGLTGLFAGMEYAAVQSERNNQVFQLGGRIYEQTVSTMTTAVTSWGQSFDQVLANAGLSWARFLANMAIQAGASQVFQAVGGFSGILGFLGLGGGGSIKGFGSGTMDMSVGAGGFGGMFSAGGGPMSAGQMSVVGEFQPELWVPNTGGNILNRQQLQALGVGEGGDGDVHVHLGGITIGEFVSPSQHRRDMMEVQRRAEAGAVAALMKMQRQGDRRMRVSGFN